ncbi:hypothetical protein [Kaarinaea lacus]
MDTLFPYAHVVAGVLIFIVGFCFHWIGQLISVLNWDLATRLGLQEQDMPAEYKIYEHAIAVADVAVAWLYGVVAVGLIINAEWGYKLAWIPGSILLYHAISAWVWEGNRRKSGHQLWSKPFRIGWCSVNMLTAGLALLVAWGGKTS